MKPAYTLQSDETINLDCVINAIHKWALRGYSFLIVPKCNGKNIADDEEQKIKNSLEDNAFFAVSSTCRTAEGLYVFIKAK